MKSISYGDELDLLLKPYWLGVQSSSSSSSVKQTLRYPSLFILTPFWNRCRLTMVKYLKSILWWKLISITQCAWLSLHFLLKANFKLPFFKIQYNLYYIKQFITLPDPYSSTFITSSVTCWWCPGFIIEYHSGSPWSSTWQTSTASTWCGNRNGCHITFSMPNA